MSPSWGGAAIHRYRTERGIAQLQELGFAVKVGRHALNQHGFISDSAENRASDIHDMFADPDVRVVLTAIGGDHSCHLLPLLDFELIRMHPKIFVGYSDSTVLAVAIWSVTGLVTFYGPALLTEFAEHPVVFDYTRDAFLGMLCEPLPSGPLAPAAEWTDELLDWGAGRDLSRPRRRIPSPGWTWLKPGVGRGVLAGGCIDSLQHLRGTRYWPNWRGAILFFETADLKPESLDGILMDYENIGILQELRGMLVGRSWGYTEAEHRELREIIWDRTARYDFPIVTDMDFGHTAPQLTLPVGCVANIDVERKRVEVTEGAVS